MYLESLFTLIRGGGLAKVAALDLSVLKPYLGAAGGGAALGAAAGGIGGALTGEKGTRGKRALVGALGGAALGAGVGAAGQAASPYIGEQVARLRGSLGRSSAMNAGARGAREAAVQAGKHREQVRGIGVLQDQLRAKGLASALKGPKALDVLAGPGALAQGAAKAQKTIQSVMAPQPPTTSFANPSLFYKLQKTL